MALPIFIPPQFHPKIFLSYSISSLLPTLFLSSEQTEIRREEGKQAEKLLSAEFKYCSFLNFFALISHFSRFFSYAKKI
jgi:hypothetical protein